MLKRDVFPLFMMFGGPPKGRRGGGGPGGEGFRIVECDNTLVIASFLSGLYQTRNF